MKTLKAISKDLIVGSWEIVGLHVQRVEWKRSITSTAQNDLSFTSVYCSQNHPALGLSDIPFEIQTYLLSVVKTWVRLFHMYCVPSVLQ